MTTTTRSGPCRAIPLSANACDGRRRTAAGWRVIVAGRAGRGARARLYKLPYSINSFAPAMTLGGIELSAKGSIRSHSSRSLPREASQRSTVWCVPWVARAFVDLLGRLWSRINISSHRDSPRSAGSPRPNSVRVRSRQVMALVGPERSKLRCRANERDATAR